MDNSRLDADSIAKEEAIETTKNIINRVNDRIKNEEGDLVRIYVKIVLEVANLIATSFTLSVAQIEGKDPMKILNKFIEDLQKRVERVAKKNI